MIGMAASCTPRFLRAMWEAAGNVFFEYYSVHHEIYEPTPTAPFQLGAIQLATRAGPHPPVPVQPGAHPPTQYAPSTTLQTLTLKVIEAAASTAFPNLATNTPGAELTSWRQGWDLNTVLTLAALLAVGGNSAYSLFKPSPSVQVDLNQVKKLISDFDTLETRVKAAEERAQAAEERARSVVEKENVEKLIKEAVGALGKRTGASERSATELKDHAESQVDAKTLQALVETVNNLKTEVAAAETGKLEAKKFAESKFNEKFVRNLVKDILTKKDAELKAKVEENDAKMAVLEQNVATAQTTATDAIKRTESLEGTVENLRMENDALKQEVTRAKKAIVQLQKDDSSTLKNIIYDTIAKDLRSDSSKIWQTLEETKLVQVVVRELGGELADPESEFSLHIGCAIDMYLNLDDSGTSDNDETAKKSGPSAFFKSVDAALNKKMEGLGIITQRTVTELLEDFKEEWKEGFTPRLDKLDLATNGLRYDMSIMKDANNTLSNKIMVMNSKLVTSEGINTVKSDTLELKVSEVQEALKRHTHTQEQKDSEENALLAGHLNEQDNRIRAILAAHGDTLEQQQTALTAIAREYAAVHKRTGRLERKIGIDDPYAVLDQDGILMRAICNNYPKKRSRGKKSKGSKVPVAGASIDTNDGDESRGSDIDDNFSHQPTTTPAQGSHHGNQEPTAVDQIDGALQPVRHAFKSVALNASTSVPQDSQPASTSIQSVKAFSESTPISSPPGVASYHGKHWQSSNQLPSCVPTAESAPIITPSPSNEGPSPSAQTLNDAIHSSTPTIGPNPSSAPDTRQEIADETDSILTELSSEALEEFEMQAADQTAVNVAKLNQQAAFAPATQTSVGVGHGSEDIPVQVSLSASQLQHASAPIMSLATPSEPLTITSASLIPAKDDKRPPSALFLPSRSTTDKCASSASHTRTCEILSPPSEVEEVADVPLPNCPHSPQLAPVSDRHTKLPSATLSESRVSESVSAAIASATSSSKVSLAEEATAAISNMTSKSTIPAQLSGFFRQLTSTQPSPSTSSNLSPSTVTSQHGRKPMRTRKKEYSALLGAKPKKKTSSSNQYTSTIRPSLPSHMVIETLSTPSPTTDQQSTKSDQQADL